MPKSQEHGCAVIGAGSWGTAVAVLLGGKGFDVSLWARDPELAASMAETRFNGRYVSDLRIPDNVWITADLKAALDGRNLVALVVPSHAMRETVKKMKRLVDGNCMVVSLTKGIEGETLMRMSEVVAQELPQARVGVLSGPNHAEEVGKKIPSATVVSAAEEEVSLALQGAFMTPYFRVYTNPDVLGVEIAGASKNVIAIAAGISDGLGYGDNTKASLMTRGLAEITRLGVAAGARALTFSGLAGMGDLIVTCTSRHSRNRGVGERLGQGKKLEEVTRETRMIAEGVRTSEAVLKLAEKLGVEVPITKAVTQVLYEDKGPADCVGELMTRGPTDELALEKLV